MFFSESKFRRQEKPTLTHGRIEARTLYTALRAATLTPWASWYNSFFKLGLKLRAKVSIDTHNLLPPAFF
jgi:hypothetical protein